MSTKQKKLRVGVVGCGAIGSRMAITIHKEFKNVCALSGIFDTCPAKVSDLSKKLSSRKFSKRTYPELLKSCDLIIEAVTAQSAPLIVKQALTAKKIVLTMSVGQLLLSQDLIQLAKKNNCPLLIPTGAIAGCDAIKAASLVDFKKITLTTRKPPRGLENNAYFTRRGIDLSRIKKETIVFDGTVEKAIKYFPKNINVAATLALACGQPKKLRVRIITSPTFKSNSHEIEMMGASGRIVTRTENVPCPDNPKTSYLAVLSGLQMLKQYCLGIMIGT